jgi:hypothetical protein
VRARERGHLERCAPSLPWSRVPNDGSPRPFPHIHLYTTPILPTARTSLTTLVRPDAAQTAANSACALLATLTLDLSLSPCICICDCDCDCDCDCNCLRNFLAVGHSPPLQIQSGLEHTQRDRSVIPKRCAHHDRYPSRLLPDAARVLYLAFPRSHLPRRRYPPSAIVACAVRASL